MYLLIPFTCPRCWNTLENSYGENIAFFLLILLIFSLLVVGLALLLNGKKGKILGIKKSSIVINGILFFLITFNFFAILLLLATVKDILQGYFIFFVPIFIIFAIVVIKSTLINKNNKKVNKRK